MYFYDKFVLLCADIGKAPTAVAHELGLNKSVVSQWRSRHSKPSSSTSVRIADYFGISVEELLNLKKETPPKPDGVTLSAKKQALLAALDRMTDEQCEAVLKLLGE